MTTAAEALIELSTITGTPLALNAADMRPVASMPHEGPLDGSRMALLLGHSVDEDVRARLVADASILTRAEPRRIEPFRGLELGRVHLPVRDGQGRLVGHLWAIDREARIDDKQWSRLQHEADRVVPAVRDPALRNPGRVAPANATTVEEFAARHPATRAIGVVSILAGLQDPAGNTTLPFAERLRPHLADALAPLGWLTTTDVSGRAVIVVGGTRDALSAERTVERIGELLRRLDKDDSVFGRFRAFASPPVLTVAELGEQIDTVGRIVSMSSAHTESVRLAEHLSSYELLVELGRISPTAVWEVPPDIRTLLSSDRGRTVAHTVKAFLDAGGNAGATATALGVHRGTLYYRIAQAEELTSYLLDRGDHRVALHLGLVAAELHGLL
ncbi:PucR family transcriptional regulator [Microbacterium saperdae]